MSVLKRNTRACTHVSHNPPIPSYFCLSNDIKNRKMIKDPGHGEGLIINCIVNFAAGNMQVCFPETFGPRGLSFRTERLLYLSRDHT